uniref:Major sperm protein n=3 Tax=Meloidogyne TaxID=189290 RepID=A0A915MAT7_MELJA
MAATPVTVNPPSIEVPAAAGNCSLELTNSAAEVACFFKPSKSSPLLNPLLQVRYCFKVKSTDNAHYRVKPVFGFVEAGGAGQLEVTRLAGPPSNDDRLEILFLPVDADTPDPKAPFSAGTSPAFVLDVPLIAQ